MTFDLTTELTALKSQTQLIRQRVYSTSRLDRYTAELLSLYNAPDNPASAAELQRWLKKKKISVARSTVTRWLRKNNG